MLFFKRGDTDAFNVARNKLFASNEKQIDNHTLILDMLYSNMSVVCTYHCRGVFKKMFCWSLKPKQLLKAPNFNFYVHKVLSKVEE